MEQTCALGWKRSICESNSYVVVNMLNEQQLDDANWHLAMVIRQILSMSNSLKLVTFSLIFYEWNRVSDSLTK